MTGKYKDLQDLRVFAIYCKVATYLIGKFRVRNLRILIFYVASNLILPCMESFQ